jgi:hypothetical protein
VLTAQNKDKEIQVNEIFRAAKAVR